MLDTSDHIVEGTRSNIFWEEKGKLLTPVLDNCGVEGVMRNYLLEKIPKAVPTENCTLERLCAAEEIFLCNSVFDIWPVLRINSGQVLFSPKSIMATSGFTKRAVDLFT